MLALPCLHWQPAGDRADARLRRRRRPLVELAPMPKRAERESDERWTLAGQVRRWLAASETPAARRRRQAWADRVVERSGVGAGTEPCFACQGRIANLGALAVATPEGDKQTFSVWRCRQCYTYYLNDWIDRWERTDNLETEERYYRLSPAEALEVLAVIENVVHAEHPARAPRTRRTAAVDAGLSGRPAGAQPSDPPGTLGRHNSCETVAITVVMTLVIVFNAATEVATTNSRFISPASPAHACERNCP